MLASLGGPRWPGQEKQVVQKLLFAKEADLRLQCIFRCLESSLKKLPSSWMQCLFYNLPPPALA